MIKNIQLWLIIPLVTIAVSAIIIVTVRPLWGTDFVGGSLLEMGVDEATDTEKIAILLEDKFGLTTTVQVTRDQTVLIRTSPLDEAKHQEVLGALKEARLGREELRFESIGPTIGRELRRKALWAVGLAVAGMIAYLSYTFRQTVGGISPWKFGVAATYALVHDILFVTAVFVILGKLFQVSIDGLFVTAMLSIMGYSVNDTIVIFDRLKEEWLAVRNHNLRDTMDRAVSLSLLRSVNTSVTIALVLIAMVLLGGPTIRWFIVALLAGTVVGTYSSIFVATPALYFLATGRRSSK